MSFALQKRDKRMSATKPLFNRSSIVRQEVLVGTVSMKDYYDLNVKSIGKGSYGSVTTARDLRTGTIRAVKIVEKPSIDNITRLKREISIMKRLDHPNIIRLFEVFEDNKILYLVMELCTGGELFDRIVKSGHFSERYAATIMKQILSAVAYCHKNDVMHRDLKPENVLYSDTSPLSSLKVIDWGFAAKCTKNHRFSSILGTPYYVDGKDNKEILRKVKVGEYTFEGRYWGKVSDLAKKLIRSLLCFEPAKRITASEALQHPWIKYYTQATLNHGVALNRKLGDVLLERFRNFQRQIKLKKLALTVIAYQISEKDISTLHQIFSALDKNGDGVLTITELCAGLANMNVKYGDEIVDLLKELDTDGNGTIDYTEFIAASLDHKLYEKETLCKAAFRVFDLDGDGKITTWVSQRPWAIVSLCLSDEIKKILELNFVQDVLKAEIIENIVMEVDRNNDGIIDFDEFMKMMRGNSSKITNSPFPFCNTRTFFQWKSD